MNESDQAFLDAYYSPDTSTTTDTSSGSSGWTWSGFLSGITGAATTGLGIYGNIVSADSAAQKSQADAAAARAKASASVVNSSTISKMLPWLFGAAVLVLGAVLLLRLKKA